MKKVLTGLILATVLFTPVIASATILDSCTINYDLSSGGVPFMGAKGPCDNTNGAGSNCATGGGANACKDGVCCVLNLITKIQNWFFAGVVILSAIFLIIGGFFFVTASGSPEKVTTAKQYIIYALIGFAVAILANGMLAFLKGVIG